MLGAFGAHSLRDQLAPEKLSAFQTATHYMGLHSLALLLVGVLSLQLSEIYSKQLRKVGVFFTTGMLMFSGSILILSLGGPKLFGPITPLGGLSLMIGWFILAWTFLRKS